VWKETDHAVAPTVPDVDWRTVVARIRDGDPDGQEILYRNLASGARLFLRRRLRPQEVEDQVHNVFVIVVEAIRHGEIREPERLMGFVRTVLYRQLNLVLSRIISHRETCIDVESTHTLAAADPTPEDHTVGHQKIALMNQALKKMSNRDFEVLARFYLHEQPPEQIRAEMKLTPTQFQLLKSRAKAKLVDSVRRQLARKSFSRE
jgi:RNA polymerase sigma factor (sigma-70 family)